MALQTDSLDHAELVKPVKTIYIGLNSPLRSKTTTFANAVATRDPGVSGSIASPSRDDQDNEGSDPSARSTLSALVALAVLAVVL